MPVTLFDLAWKTLVELGVTRTGTATNGATNTIVDTNGLKNIDNDYYNEGTAFVLYDAGGADAAPQGEFSIVSDYAKLTNTLTLQNALTAAVAASDKYGVASSRFQLHAVIETINLNLFADVYIPKVDTSLTTVSGQLEYTLPTGVDVNLLDVLVATDTTSLQEDPKPVLNWEIKWNATGTAQTLFLHQALPAGMKMYLVYGARHPDLRVASDKLDEAVHPDIVVFAAARDLLQAYVNKTRLKNFDRKLEVLDIKAQRAMDEHPLPPLPGRRARVPVFTRAWYNQISNIERYGRP